MARADVVRTARACAAPLDAAEARRALLSWYRRAKRELPWRRRRSPYEIWVSEVMLQQTRVEAVIEPFGRFLERFPSLEALAAAEEAEVLAAWSGLGYYRRARLLHAGARRVVEAHGGELPASREALERIPGIGDYTAGALLSMAFGQRVPALDANVTRVVARLAGIAEPAAARDSLRALAQALVDCRRPGDVNEALMDLGSAVCTARVARCDLCPLASRCAAFASGSPLDFAVPRARKAPRQVQLACAVLRDGERVLFVRRPADDALLAGLWDLPLIEAAEGSDCRPPLESLLRERAGLVLPLEGPVATVRHDIVGRRITAQIYVAQMKAKGKKSFGEGIRLLSPAERARVGMPALPVKILRALEARATPRSS